MDLSRPKYATGLTTGQRLFAHLHRQMANLKARDVLPEDGKVMQLRPSPNQRQAGAWSWCIATADGRQLDVGSQHSMSNVLRCDELKFTFGRGSGQGDPAGVEIDPCRQHGG